MSDGIERTTHCSSILKQGVVYIFVRGWQAESLEQLTVDFILSDANSAHVISQLDVKELQSIFYQLSFPSDTELDVVTKYVSFLQNPHAIQSATTETMVVALFRIANLEGLGRYGLVAAYIPQSTSNNRYIELISRSGFSYHYFPEMDELETVASRSTPENVNQFLNDWGFENCQ